MNLTVFVVTSPPQEENKRVITQITDNIFNITLERAEELLKGAPTRQAGKVLGINPKDNTEITLNFGPYGAYLKSA